jgi:hypothetical protein
VQPNSEGWKLRERQNVPLLVMKMLLLMMLLLLMIQWGMVFEKVRQQLHRLRHRSRAAVPTA